SDLNADDDLGRPKPRHLLGLLEGDRAVVDDRSDVGHGPGLHVGQPLAAPANPPDGAVALIVDLEDERLRKLGADVERRTGRERRLLVTLPYPAPEGHLAAASRPAGRCAPSGRI